MVHAGLLIPFAFGSGIGILPAGKCLERSLFPNMNSYVFYRSILLSAGFIACAFASAQVSVDPVEAEQGGGHLEQDEYRDTLYRSDILPPPPLSDDEIEGNPATPHPNEYFPTLADLALLGDSDYARRGSGGPAGPDRRLQNATDIFPYESGPDDFYTQNRGFFGPINQVLGLFTTQKAFTGEFADIPLSGYTVDSNIGLLTRTMQPERAHLKVGPLAFDLLWLEAGALWSDYDGPQTFAEGEEDGWISYVSLAIRSTAQLTDSIFLSFASELIYLPGSNELAFRNGLGARPALSAEIFYQKRLGTWDLLVFDRFLGRPGVDLYADWDEPGIDRAGRYRFGFYGREGRTQLFDTQDVTLTNQIGFRASSMVGASDWRFLSALDHRDFWRTFDFEDHRYRDSIGLAMGYEGNDIPFAPLFSYRAVSTDRFDSVLQNVSIQLRGRLTENIKLTAMGGYFWTEGFANDQSRAAWSAAINHQFSQRGSHAFSVGQRLIEDPFSPEILFTTYYRYVVDYQLAQRLNAGAFAQYSTGDRLVSADPNVPTGSFDNFLTGVNLSFLPLDFTRISGLATYSISDQDSITTRERWIYRVTLSQQLGSRLTFQALYQFQDVSGSADFDEHLVSGSLRWYF